MLLLLLGPNMDPDNPISLVDFLNSIENLKIQTDKKSAQQIKDVVNQILDTSSNFKKINISTLPDTNEDNVVTNPFDADISDDEKAILHINNLVKDLADLPSCKYFTNSGSPNVSKDYKFANIAPLNTCSSSFIYPDSNNLNSCPIITNQSSCIGYQMDYSIVSKYSVDTKSYYLIRYRKITGSITYLIADSAGFVYQVISHNSSLSYKDNNLDEDASNIFSSYISDLISNNDFDLEFPVNEKKDEKQRSSYLSYVLG